MKQTKCVYHWLRKPLAPEMNYQKTDKTDQKKKNDYVWFQNNQQLHHTLGVDENVKQQFLAAK